LNHQRGSITKHGNRMKHLLLTLLFTLMLFEQAFSDAGNCIKYDVDIQLASGKKIRGFLYHQTYQPKFQFKDNSFLDYLHHTYGSGALAIYKKIRQLKFPIIGENQYCHFQFNATTIDNLIIVQIDQIKTVKVLSYTVCNNCDSTNEKEGYYWSGIYPNVITELVKTEIDLLQTKPIASIGFGFDTRTDGYWMISYATDYEKKNLEKLRDDFLMDINKLLKENKWEIVEKKYRAFKNRLREKKIIIFKMGYTD
jgi:hypothetical protein